MKERGQGLVEFALVLPMLMFIMLGLAALGMAYANAEAVENAASEGSRAPSVWRPFGTRNCLDEVTNAVTVSTLRTVTVTVSDNCTDNPADRIPSGELVTVRVEHDYVPLFFGTIRGGQWTILLAAEVSQAHE